VASKTGFTIYTFSMPNFHTASTVDAVNTSAAAMGSAATANRRTYASMYISDSVPRPVLSIGLVSMKKLETSFFFSISINM
jgi:hypothetical protein